MIRSASGNNDHPDPMVFLLIFRMLCTYSLVKPPTRCNVTEADLLDALMSADDPDIHEKPTGRSQWSDIKDVIINKTEAYSSDFSPDYEVENAIQLEDLTDTNDGILRYLAGYVAKKATKFNKCSECHSVILSSSDPNPLGLIECRNYFNVLHSPSDALFCML